MWILIVLVFCILSLFITAIVGTLIAKKHDACLDALEAQLVHIEILNIKNLPDGIDGDACDTSLVMGTVVMAIDDCRKFLSVVRCFFGGEIKLLDSLMVRARREAIVRMKQQAQSMNATVIINLKLSSSDINTSSMQNMGSIVEVICYGTAIASR